MKSTTDTTSVSKAPRFKGRVVSVSGSQTVSVSVDTYKTHPKYRKKYQSTKKYLVHIKDGSFAVGDMVTFIECRPVSKRKRHVAVTPEGE